MTDILDLEGWKAIDRRIEDGEYVVEAEYMTQPDACLKCGVIGRFYKHGPKPITIRDSPIRGKPLRILAQAKRYKCRECGGTFLQPLGGLYKDMRMTERCVEFIEEQCLRDTFVRIAEHVGCDDKTIRTLASGYIERLNADYNPWLPEWLGIDETMIDGVQRCVITDVVNRLPIDMLADRDLPTVAQWLHRFRDRSVVKGLAIDMWRPYKTAAHTVFPGLPVIIDKFHLVRMANTAMDNVRIALAKDQTKDVGRDWMRRKSLLRMRYKNLDEKGRFNLQMWLDNEPEVAAVYRLKEAFYDIYDAPNKDDAGRLLDEWRASVPTKYRKTKKDFQPLMTSTKNWREEMLAFFDHPITNGYTEALNGVAKVINRAGRGYSFDVLRARLLFGTKATPRRIAKATRPPTTMTRSLEWNEGHRTLMEALGSRCESCGGVFEPEFLEAHHVVPLVDGEKPRRLYLCPNCHRRFHTEYGVSHHSNSTD